MLVFVSCMWSGAAPGVAHKKIIIKKERERERGKKKQIYLLRSFGDPVKDELDMKS